MLLTIGISLLAVIAFGVGLSVTGIMDVGRRVIQTTTAGLSAMMDPELDDLAKEKAVRRAGLSLIGAAINILWRFALALGAAAAPIYAAEGIGLRASAEVFALMLRLDYILIVSVVMTVAVALFHRRRQAPGAASAAKSDYSKADRFFHELAFSHPAVLRMASWIEDKIIVRSTPQSPPAPIFVTSLARAGTTALLNALYDIPGMATHTYRDMPFLTSPTLWYRLSGGAKRHVERHQRAHGDGLEIDLDTPEAFEEVLWKMFWPEKYRDTAIETWHHADHKPRAEQFLHRHMAKIVDARRRQGRIENAAEGRYFSKNNANISRISFLLETFPGCKIVVPVRRPECHVASLMRQHRNFLQRHQEDDFIRRYMRDIGHFEFGKLHKPILFPGFSAGEYDPSQNDYWLSYWIHVFRHLLEYRDDCLFVLQDDLRATPGHTMSALCRKLGIEAQQSHFDGYFRNEPDVAETEGLSPALLAEAYDIYNNLKQAALR